MTACPITRRSKGSPTRLSACSSPRGAGALGISPTEGVPAAVWTKRGAAKARRELVDAGLAEVLDDGDIYMHDYPEHQRTAAEVHKIRADRTRAGRRGNHIKHHVLAGVVNADCEYCVTDESQDDRTGLANGSQVRPQTARKSSPDTDTEIDINTPQSPPPGGGRDARNYEDHPDFLRFWAVYPRKTGKPAAFRAWKAAMKRGVDPEIIVKAAAGYRDDPARRPDYTKHPGPWLNDDRFNDQSTPRSEPRPWWEN